MRLWHLPPSHFNEKVRWALDFKGLEHERRAPLPPAHMAAALWLTRGRAATLPLLELDGRAVADSTAIIAALEERFPEPALYPAEPAERARALALEDFFDEGLGPAARLIAFHALRREPEALAAFSATLLPGPLAGTARVRRLAGAGAGAFVQARYRVDAEAADADAQATVLAAFDRLESELAHGDGDHLVGDRFSVADLTAASLFVPVVMPPEGPAPPPVRIAGQEAFIATVRDRPGFVWVRQTFARYRENARRP